MMTSIAREWDVPGRYSDTVDRFARELAADGWTGYATLADPGLETVFCRDSRQLTVWKRASFEDDWPPHHRVRIELRWSGTLTAADCRDGAPR
jgi:hypothetical protein